MSAGSPKFTVRRIAALSLVSLWLAGCSDTSNPPAPVSSVNGNAPANTNSGMLITPPPKMGTTSTAQQPQIQPVQQPQIQATQQPQIQPVQPVAQQPVQMENGRIVYNRQYGNIPKGSYSGSTYTVKKGDTLFYIAWITGNDFRDLAQRNNKNVAEQQANCDHSHSACNGTNSKHNRADCQQYINQYAYLHLALAD